MKELLPSQIAFERSLFRHGASILAKEIESGYPLLSRISKRFQEACSRIRKRHPEVPVLELAFAIKKRGYIERADLAKIFGIGFTDKEIIIGNEFGEVLRTLLLDHFTEKHFDKYKFNKKKLSQRVSERLSPILGPGKLEEICQDELFFETQILENLNLKTSFDFGRRSNQISYLHRLEYPQIGEVSMFGFSFSSLIGHSLMTNLEPDSDYDIDRTLEALAACIDLAIKLIPQVILDAKINELKE